VSFDHVPLSEDAVLGEDQGGAVLDAVLDCAAAAIAADCLGGAQRVLEMSVEYATSRVQFGRAIGSFQAIKHRCADMLMLVERSRSAVQLATEALARGAEDVPRWTSIAKAVCGDAYGSVAGQGVQVHGGIGFTWEHDIHLYLKRAKLDQALFGDSRHHLDRLADALLNGERIAHAG
jgi:acyl-CoA dehydrogenase